MRADMVNDFNFGINLDIERNLNFDFEDFEFEDFEFGSFDFENLEFGGRENKESKIERLKKRIQDRLELRGKALDNLFKMVVCEQNEWGIPRLKPFTDGLDGIEWNDFNNKKQIKNRAKTAIHFYIEDYQFEVVWRNPDKYISLFKDCAAVVTPDFSNYTDMPKAQHLWNHYRRQWLGAYWQKRGINIIPSLSWAVGHLYDFCFMGIPKNTTLATSFTNSRMDKETAILDLSCLIDVLKPCKLFIKASDSETAVLKEFFEFEQIKPHKYTKG